VLATIGMIVGVLLVVVGAAAIAWAVHRSDRTSPPTTVATTDPTTSAPATVTGNGAVVTSAEAVALVTKTYPDYRVTDASGWHDGAPVAALVGTRAGDGRQQVFLFAGGHLFGRDLAEPSWNLAVVSVDADTVTVRYDLYRAGDRPPDGPVGQQILHFHFNGTRFRPLEHVIASADEAVAGHR
jgi:hypothetical protein